MEPKDPESNQRRDDRIKHQIYVRARQVKPFDPKAAWDVYTVKNISKNGLLFYSNQAYPAGTELEIRIMNPYIADESICWGSVVRSTPLERMKGYFGIALELVKIDGPTRKALDKTIEFFLDKEKQDLEG